MRRVRNKQPLPVCVLGVVVAALATAAMLSGSCFLDTKTTFCGQVLHCPPGWVCSADQETCVKAGNCGDGRINDLEVCDDSNNSSGDGCSSDCTSNETCGNDILDVAIGEQCDDGNTTPGDGCSAECTSEGCGNLIVDVEFGEQCDTGPGDSLGCNFDCTFRRCGDGYVNSEAAEDCDRVGDVSDRQDCDRDCTTPLCGDMHTNPKFKPPGDQSQFEECDDGANTSFCNGNDNGDNSNPAQGKGNCQRPECGDRYINPSFKNKADQAEQCDAGMDTSSCNGNNNMHGIGSCQMAKCGDGYTNAALLNTVGQPEQCDAGMDTSSCNGNNNMHGPGSCQNSQCGDGYRNAADGEQCDWGDFAKPNGDVIPDGKEDVPCSGDKFCDHVTCKCS